MKMPDKVNPELVLYGAAAIALLYVVYKSTKAVGGAIDSVTSLPGKAVDAAASVWHSAVNTASSAWHTATDIFEGSSVAAGTTTSPRTVDPVNGTFQEGVSNSIDLFDPRFYGVQGQTILPAQTNQSGPGGAGQAVGASGNAPAYFSSTNPLGNMTGL